jgi:DNA-binding MarR family transcriptional regulator
LKPSLQRRHLWAKFILSPDTIVPHRVPFTLARRLHLICNTVLAELLAEEEVKAPLAYHAIALIDDFPGIDQRHLATLMGVDRTNVGQIVDDLEASGFVERRVSRIDRRARELRVTRRAATLRNRMRERVLGAQAGVLAPLTEAERVVLVDLLTRVVEANQMHARPGAGRRPPRRKNIRSEGRKGRSAE